MTNNHPMKPTEDQIREWARFDCCDLTPEGLWRRIAHAAYAAGADAELEACIDWLSIWHGLEHSEILIDLLRAARRPKPPSLKEQGLQALGRFNANAHTTADEMMADFDTIRRALEQLDD